MKAYDLLVQAESGLSEITGNEAGRRASACRSATSPPA
jgi:crotonobetainyl-CoA:carnitine CoA-transferase CaiB-like acyl-CoA transferase